MTIGLLNPVARFSSSYGVSPCSAGISAPVSGRRLIVHMSSSTALPSTPILTDDQGNTYDLVYSLDENGIKWFFISHTLTGTMPTSLVISWTGGGSYLFYLLTLEAEGLATDPLDFSGGVGFAYGESVATTYSTTQANEAVVAFGHIYTPADFTITEAGFTRHPSGATSNALVYKADDGTSGSGKTLTLNWVGASGSGMMLLTLKQDAGISIVSGELQSAGAAVMAFAASDANAIMYIDTPASRLVKVRAEQRVQQVLSEDRITMVRAERRAHRVSQESRLHSIRAERRIYTVEAV